jgi:hypothetical protein
MRYGGLPLAIALGVGLAPDPVLAARPAPFGPDLAILQPLLDDALDASEVNGVQRDNARVEFEALAREVTARFGGVRSPERRARRLHDYLHAHVFRLYRDDADGIPAVLERGEFNCVSATVVEGFLDRVLGLDPWVVPGVKHVFLRVDLGTRTVDVEATAADGFDVHGDSEKARRFLLIYKLATPDEIATRGARSMLDAQEGFGAAVRLEEAPAFVWHNAAERTLARGEGRRAAEVLAEGEARHPGIGARPEDVQAFLARAFRVEFDARRYRNAYRIASLAVTENGGGDASSENRLVAVAAELVDDASDGGDLGFAEQTILDVRGLIGDRGRRFERRALPVVVAAAVRLGDWDRADRLAGSYTAVEPDAVESARLAAWVRERREAESPAP